MPWLCADDLGAVAAWVFREPDRFVGTDLSTMWRWLRTNPAEGDVAGTRSILPTARTVHDWLKTSV
ncbi:MAG TPA: hypothetical protein VF821_11265 [Lentzea sp.]